MHVQCTSCRRVITVPDDRAGNPRLKIKCGCGTVFVLGEAALAPAPPPAATAAPSPPTARPPAPAPVPAAPAPPRPAPEPPPHPAAAAPAAPRPAASPVSFQATAAVGQEAPGAPRGAAWRRCAKHPQTRSQSLCPQCFTGFCAECQHKVQNAVTCQKCEVLCIDSSDYEERLRRDRQRARPMMEELSTIASYPLVDPMAFVMLAVFTWVFAALGNFAVLYGKMIALLFSQGVLMAYCFSALSRVSGGNLKDYMPDIGDITDLLRTLRLGVTALLAGSGPMILVVLMIPGAMILTGMRSAAQEPPAAQQMPVMGEDGPMVVEDAGETDADPATGMRLVGLALTGIFFGGLALIWKVVYTPVALTVAALSRSSMSTLNPVVGFDTIRTMGGVYWQAMGIYTVIAAAQWILGLILSLIPILGGLVMAFIDAYAYLMVGCTLGLAVFKKAPELGLE